MLRDDGSMKKIHFCFRRGGHDGRDWGEDIEMFKQFLWLMFLNQSMMTSVSGALSQDMGSLKGMNPEG